MPYSYTRQQARVGKVPLSIKIYYGIGFLPDTLKNFAFSTFLLFYYNQVLQMPAVYASTAIAVAIVVDAITDPLVGSYSDGIRTRLGRRHLLMYVSAVPLGVFLYLVFAPPAGLGDIGNFLWLTTFAIATRVAMTFFAVPWNALFAELSDDYAERSSILTFRNACAWIGGSILIWCTWTFIFPSTPEFTPGHMNPAGYHLFAIVVASLVTMFALLTTWLTRNQIPYLLQPEQAARFGLKKAFSDVMVALKNPDYLILFSCILLFSVIGGTLGALDIYIQTYFWGLRPEDLRWFTLVVIGSLFAFVSIPALQRRFDKKHLAIASMVFLFLNGIGMIGLRFLDVLPDNGSPNLLYILISNEIVRAAAGTIVGIMFVSMMADTLDKQELQTGRRQEGVFSSVLSFAGKATSGVGIMLGGLILDYLLRFPRGVKPTDVDHTLIIELGIVAGFALPLLYLIPYWLTTRYSITRAMHAEIQASLSVARADVVGEAMDQDQRQTSG